MAEREDLDMLSQVASQYQIITTMNEDAVEGTAMQFVMDFGQLVDDFYNQVYELKIDELIALDYWSRQLAYNKKLSKEVRNLLKKCNQKLNNVLAEIGLDLNIFVQSC